MAADKNPNYYMANPSYKQSTPYIPPSYYDPNSMERMRDSINNPVAAEKFKKVNAIEQAARITKPSEKFSSTVYKDSAGHLTVGYGQRATDKNQMIDEPSASEWMFDRLGANHRRLMISSPAYANANPNQQGALLDLSYNIGDNWEKYTDFYHYSQDPKGASYLIQMLPAFRRDDKGQIQEGLVKRRSDEQRLGTDPNDKEYFPSFINK